MDDYNGEEKPPQSLEGLTIKWPGTSKKEVRYTCRTKPKTDYTDLQAVLSDSNQAWSRDRKQIKSATDGMY